MSYRVYSGIPECEKSVCLQWQKAFVEDPFAHYSTQQWLPPCYLRGVNACSVKSSRFQMLPDTKAVERRKSHASCLIVPHILLFCFIFINYHSPAYLILWIVFSFTFWCAYMGTRCRIFSGMFLHQVIGWRSVTGAQFKATCRFRNATILHTLSHKLIHLLSRGETIHIRKKQHMVCHPQFGTCLNHGSSCLMISENINTPIWGFRQFWKVVMVFSIHLARKRNY